MKLAARVLALSLFAATAPASAEVSVVGPGGFTSTHTLDLPAAPAETWRVLVEEVDQWWDGGHSWSGDADNLYIDATAGGCFCEKLPGGGWVEHLRVIYLSPGRELRLRGALGPLMQMGLQGTMTWRIEATDGGSRLHWTYIVQGFIEGGFETLAPVVDRVNAEQAANLTARLGSD